MKVVAIVQARMGSIRLPDKVMKRIGGTPLIELLLARLSRAKELDEIVLATTEDPRDQRLVDHVTRLGYKTFRGSEDDVLGRYVGAARTAKADFVVRITGDCPLVDPDLVDQAICRFTAAEVDYLSNTAPPTYPDGLDVEVIRFSALERAWAETDNPHNREHVTPYLRDFGRFTVASMCNDENLSAWRWTVDEPADLEVARNVFSHFAPRLDFGWREIVHLLRERPELFAANQGILSGEGAKLGSGQKLWKRAKRIIPGGNMLLSKRAEMFLPDRWPAYFSRAKGCRVWDLDGNEYIDMSMMGVGTNTLGYGHERGRRRRVRTVVAKGNMSTFNCPEEVYLVEKLLELHPWADMGRLARSGGEANAIAIRIGRAASGRDKVAICGYHGWHDWYLAANLADEQNLAGHLLSGLEVRGVPKTLYGTVYPFEYNNYEQLEALMNAHEVGVIKMEVSRNKDPENSFLQKIRHPRRRERRRPDLRRVHLRVSPDFWRLAQALRSTTRHSCLRKSAWEWVRNHRDRWLARGHGGRAIDLHQQHLLDRADRPQRGIEDARSDGSPALMGNHHGSRAAD